MFVEIAASSASISPTLRCEKSWSARRRASRGTGAPVRVPVLDEAGTALAPGGGRTATGEALPPLQGHTGPVGALKVNPTRMLLASACSALCLWLPQPPQQQLQQHMQQQHPTGMMG